MNDKAEGGGSAPSPPAAEERRCVDCERPLAQSDMDPDPHKRCWRAFRFVWPITPLANAAEIGCLTAGLHLWRARARAAAARGRAEGLREAEEVCKTLSASRRGNDYGSIGGAYDDCADSIGALAVASNASEPKAPPAIPSVVETP